MTRKTVRPITIGWIGYNEDGWGSFFARRPEWVKGFGQEGRWVLKYAESVPDIAVLSRQKKRFEAGHLYRVTLNMGLQLEERRCR